MKHRKITVFSLKALLFLVLLWSVDRGIGAAFVAMKDCGLKVNPENMWLKTPFVVEKVSTDVVVIGSSKASHHYVPSILSDSLGMSVYNGGQDGCFFLYQNCLINMLMDRYHPKMIIWDIQPSSFYGKNTATEYQNFRYLSPYYHKNKWATEYINSESEKMRFRMLSEMFAYNSKSLNYLFPLISHTSSTHEGYLPLENEGYAYPSLHEVSKISEEDYVPMEDRLALLEKTILRCKKEHIRLFLFISPEYSIKPHAYQLAVNDLQELANINGVDCHDYSSDIVFMNDSTFFKDSNHLNDKGARLFTNRILNNLMKRI